MPPNVLVWPGLVGRLIEHIQPEGKFIFPDKVSSVGDSAKYQHKHYQHQEFNISQ
ncbi:MAG: hypothetical protein JRJ79_16440 [Deltaproteobacteria bacterium]|nr:hypothetical protein [Deltaproteobacteria bacterium]